MTALYVVLGTLGLTGGLIAWAILQARTQGRGEERETQTRNTLERVDDAKKAREDIGALAPAARREWLSKWTRR